VLSRDFNIIIGRVGQLVEVTWWAKLSVAETECERFKRVDLLRVDAFINIKVLQRLYRHRY